MIQFFEILEKIHDAAYAQAFKHYKCNPVNIHVEVIKPPSFAGNEIQFRVVVDGPYNNDQFVVFTSLSKKAVKIIGDDAWKGVIEKIQYLIDKHFTNGKFKKRD